jgi:hypothetical protein
VNLMSLGFTLPTTIMGGQFAAHTLRWWASERPKINVTFIVYRGEGFAADFILRQPVTSSTAWKS